MAPVNKQHICCLLQLICLLATLFTNETQVLQVLNSCASTVRLLLEEYLKSQMNLERQSLNRIERFAVIFDVGKSSVYAADHVLTALIPGGPTYGGIIYATTQFLTVCMSLG